MTNIEKATMIFFLLFSSSFLKVLLFFVNSVLYRMVLEFYWFAFYGFNILNCIQSLLEVSFRYVRSIFFVIEKAIKRDTSYSVNVSCILQLMMTVLSVETHQVKTCGSVNKSTSCLYCS